MSEQGIDTRGSDTAGSGPLAWRYPRENGEGQSTPQPQPGTSSCGTKYRRKTTTRRLKTAKGLDAGAKSGVRRVAVGKNIIGRSSGVGTLRRVINAGAGSGRALFGDAAFALVDQPAGEHGVGVFFEPLIEQCANFLADVGGVAEPGEFVALQGVARGG